MISGDSVIGTLDIASIFKREHRMITRMVKRYSDEMEKIGALVTETARSNGGRKPVEYRLSGGQCILLISLLRNNEKGILCKQEMAQLFGRTSGVAKTISNALKGFDFDGIDDMFVYAAQDSLGNIKIGITSDVDRRLKELNTANSIDLELIFVKRAKNAGYMDETILHNKADKYHIKNEWYSSEAQEMLV